MNAHDSTPPWRSVASRSHACNSLGACEPLPAPHAPAGNRAPSLAPPLGGAFFALVPGPQPPRNIRSRAAPGELALKHHPFVAIPGGLDAVLEIAVFVRQQS